MKTTDDILDNIYAIMGEDPVSRGDIQLSFRFDTFEEAQSVLTRLGTQQENLRALQVEIADTIAEIAAISPILTPPYDYITEMVSGILTKLADAIQFIERSPEYRNTPPSTDPVLNARSATKPNMEYEACICFSCNQKIEFPRRMAGQTVNCPTCAQALILPDTTPQVIHENRKGLLAGFLAKVGEVKARHREAKHHRECLEALNDKLAGILEDGLLEPHEADQLIEALQQFAQSGFHVTENEAADLFTRIVAGIQWRCDTEQQIARLQNTLDLQAVPAAAAAFVASGRAIVDLELGNVPWIEAPNVVLRQFEKAYWSEPAQLMEERVVRRRYEGGQQGVNVRIMKGVSVRVGGHRGSMVSDTGLVSVSSGELILTQSRFYFAGDRKSFSMNIGDIGQFTYHPDGITLFEAGTEKPRIVQFSDTTRGSVFQAAVTGMQAKTAIEIASMQAQIRLPGAPTA